MMDRNAELCAARQARPSSYVAGEPMSRAELAEAVNAELWRATGRRSSIDAHTIARYERGAVRWPNAAYRSALRAVLGMSTDAELGFVPSPRGAGSTAAPGSLSGKLLDDLEVSGRRPVRIGWTDVEHIRRTTAALAQSDNRFGGGRMCEAAVSQLKLAAGLLSARADVDVRTALVEALGNMAGVVAFAAFDINDDAAAQRCFRYSLWCAEESGSWALRANTLADMSRTVAHAGRLDEALSLIELAQVRSDRVSATARAMMSMLRGRVLALLGRSSEAVEELLLSDGWMAQAQADPGIDPPWLCYYDSAEHQGSTGRAFGVLASRTGDPSTAVQRLGKAVELAGDLYPRSRTFSRIRLATLLMLIGDVDKATTIGRQAAHEARTFRSHRMSDELGGLIRTCRAQGQNETAVDLNRVISTHNG